MQLSKALSTSFIIKSTALVLTGMFIGVCVHQYEDGVRLETFRLYHTCKSTPDVVGNCEQFNPYIVE